MLLLLVRRVGARRRARAAADVCDEWPDREERECRLPKDAGMPG